MWSDIYLLFQGDLENIVQSSFCGNFFLSLLYFEPQNFPKYLF